MDTRPAPPLQTGQPLSAGRTAVFAASAGILVLALFASQPLVGIIGPDLGLTPQLSGLTTTLTAVGYATGLVLLVPLSDVVENRGLIVATLAADVLALAFLAAAPGAGSFLAGCFVVGIATSAIQMLVPLAAILSPEASRGRTVGNVMSGQMLGILLSRPAASLITEVLGWRAVYGLLATSVAVLTLALAFLIPVRRPAGRTTYPRLIASLWAILRDEPVLRRRAASQALCMGAFGVFWTAIALRLAGPPFSLGQVGIALFAFAGAAGAVIAPIAGRAGDRGLTRPATALAHGAVIAAMGLACFGGMDAAGHRTASLVALLLAAVLLDLGVVGEQALGRRAINLIRPEARGRINGLFTGLFFLGSAVGAMVSGPAWAAWGWGGICAIGAAFGLGAVGVSLAAERPRLRARRGP